MKAALIWHAKLLGYAALVIGALFAIGAGFGYVAEHYPTTAKWALGIGAYLFVTEYLRWCSRWRL